MSAHVRFTSHMEFWSAARIWQLFKLSGTPHPTLACMIDCWQFPSEEAGVLVAGAVLTESFQSAISMIETWILVIFAGLESTEDSVRQTFFFFFNNLGGADHSVRFDTKKMGISFHVPEFRKSVFTNLMLFIFIFHLYWLFCPWKCVSSSLIPFPRCISVFHLSLVFVLSEVTELISLSLKILPQLFRTKFNSWASTEGFLSSHFHCFSND